MRRIFAHRGLSGIAPENTLTAIKGCREAGVKWFETDVDIIADGTPVIIHDTLLDRTTNRSGSIYDLTKADLANIDAGSWFSPKFTGEKLPTLAELIDVVNEYELNFNLELKPNEQGRDRSIQLIEAVLAELARLNFEREVLVSSFSHVLLAEFKKRAPQYPVGCLFDGPVTDDWRSVAELIGAEYLHPALDGLTKDRVQEIRKAGFGVNVYTVNQAKTINQLFNWGVTGVFTDYAHQFIHLGRD